MKILIAVDGSAGSFEAVAQIGRLVTPITDQIALYCSPPELRVSSKSTAPEIMVRMRDALAVAIFDEARKRLPPAVGAAAETIVDEHDPRQGIVTASERWGAEMVVVGARGLGMFDRLLLGSVSRAVAHTAKVPVWVSRAGQAAQGMNLLLACEQPEQGRRAAELLGRFQWPSDTTCRTLTVITALAVGRLPDWLQHRPRSPEIQAMVAAWAHEHEEEVRASVAKMQAACHDLPAPCGGCQALVAEGEPTAEILKTIQREKIDLVAVGVRRKHSLAEVILGSTSEAVLNHAACSVLLVPQRAG